MSCIHFWSRLKNLSVCLGPSRFCGTCWQRGIKGGSDWLRALAEADDYAGDLVKVRWEPEFRGAPCTHLACLSHPCPFAVWSLLPHGLSVCLVSVC